MPAMAAFSLWLYWTSDGGLNTALNALVLSCLGLAGMMVEEVRYWLRGRRQRHRRSG